MVSNLITIGESVTITTSHHGNVLHHHLRCTDWLSAKLQQHHKLHVFSKNTPPMLLKHGHNLHLSPISNRQIRDLTQFPNALTSGKNPALLTQITIQGFYNHYKLSRLYNCHKIH